MGRVELPDLVFPCAVCAWQNTKGFVFRNLQMLVIDEADRILEQGFEVRFHYRTWGRLDDSGALELIRVVDSCGECRFLTWLCNGVCDVAGGHAPHYQDPAQDAPDYALQRHAGRR
jgi:hypothetical protein